MSTTNDSFGRGVAFPFYIFLTLLMGYLGVLAGRDLWRIGEGDIAILSSILFISLIGLYWLNFALTNRGTHWWFFYYPAQTALMVSVVFLLRGYSSVGMSFLISATICIVGEVLGVWGNSRRALLIGIFYVGLLFGVLYAFTERADLYNALTGLLVNGGVVVLFMIMLNQQLAERQKATELAEKLESTNAKLAAYAAKIESLTLQNERQRMARELHDTLAQGVAGLVLQLEAVKAHLTAQRNERASAIVEQALARARSTLAESRAAIDDLRAEPENILDAVQDKVARFTQATGIPCEGDISVHDNQLSTETTTHALNILKEALANITRHAQATQSQVKFSIQAQTLELEIRDNGVGFDERQDRNGHYGLLGMRERARMTGGVLTIESTPSNGTRIHLQVGRAE